MIFLEARPKKKWTKGPGYRKHILVSSRLLDNCGAQLQVSEIPARGYVPPHYHRAQTEIIYALSGRAVYAFGQRKVTIKRGDVLVIMPGDIHDAKGSRTGPFRFLTFKLRLQLRDTVWLKKTKGQSSIKPDHAASVGNALSEVIGAKAMPRTVVAKKLWAYIRKHRLQDTSGGALIKADDRLRALFGKRKTIREDDIPGLLQGLLGDAGD